jgi:SagB-type dehydrogenase family enzyme
VTTDPTSPLCRPADAAGAAAALAFHDDSSIDRWQIVRRAAPAFWDAPAAVRRISFKSYPRLAAVPLPEPGPAPDASLGAVLQRRRSEREPSAISLGVGQLSALLHWSVGHAERDAAGDTVIRRHYPSAGARFPVELYLVALRCDGIAEGLYHIAAPPRALERLPSPAGLAEAIARTFGYDWVGHSRAVVLLTAVINRTAVKYGSRGYRYALLEAGHLAQNLCLTATALGLPSAPVGGFADSGLLDLIRPTTGPEVPLYAVVLT